MQQWERAINTPSVRRTQNHNTKLPTHTMKKRKGKQKIKRERAARPIKRHRPCSWNPCADTIEYGSARSVHRDTDRGIIVPWILRGSAASRSICVPCATNAPHLTRTGTYGPGREHHKEVVSGCSSPCTAYVILPQIDDVQCHTQTHIQLKN